MELINTNIQANLCAFEASAPDKILRLNTDSVQLIIDTGASAGFSQCLNDSISFKPITGQVHGLGSMKIRGIGTLKYNILDDMGNSRIIMVRDSYYVPTMPSRLISPQQFINQTTNGIFVVNKENSTLSWGDITMTIPYNKSNNLAIIRTKP